MAPLGIVSTCQRRLDRPGLDVYSRKIVAHEVHAEESGHHAAMLIERAVLRERIAGQPLVIHQDHGSPMKASTFVAKLQELGIDASYSRPSVSDDNAYAESLFRTCKYRPEYPGVFASLDEAAHGRYVLSAGTTASTSIAI